VSYVPHTPDEIERMLERIGVSSIEELFDSIPAALRQGAELKLPPALAERGLLDHLGALAARNVSSASVASFLGGGAYHHHIPAVVDSLSSRSEFLTAYTPYQGEVSQGTLQAIFEFQTLICQLTGLEVANASLYDGASAVAEAALMAMRVTRRRKVRVSRGLHPSYAQVLRTYTQGLDAEIEPLDLAPDGRSVPAEIADDVACVIVQSPNFFGCVEDLEPFADAAHAAGALLVGVTTEALALALLREPGRAGVDIACGDAQSFGVPLGFGGPYVGFMAARQKHVRQLPGRLIGETVDASGERAFVMTLTTREQHIRRERATSNICTNQGLMALRATIYLALLGRRGLRRLAEINLSLACYAREQLERAGLRRAYDAPFFNEFVVEVPGLTGKLDGLLERGLLGGLALERLDPARRDQLLVCTTEMNRREDIDRLVRELAT
jgi:glycine dehydrogenase subunit 1